jgi:hypothetical protein
MKEIDPGLADALDVVAKARLEKAVTEHKPHSELRELIEFVRQGPAYPDQPWHEFIKFAEENEARDPDYGPFFFRDTARVGRYVRSLEEQHEALLAEWSDYRATTEDIITDLKEQLEALDDAFCELIAGNTTPELAHERLQEIRGESSPASRPA